MFFIRIDKKESFYSISKKKINYKFYESFFKYLNKFLFEKLTVKISLEFL